MASRTIDVAALLEQARQTTGLDDFGSSSYRAGLERLGDSLNEEADLSDIGHASATGLISSLLTDRLQVERWWRDHPELTNERVERPIVIVGMSRSGTTALSQLLAKDPALRPLMRWEAMAAVPPPDPAAWRQDARYLATVQADQRSEAAMPGLRALHYDPPDGPVECNQLFAHEFQGSMFWTTFRVPSFYEWTTSADQTDPFTYHHRMLQLLQSRLQGTWSLKAPQHGVAMEALRRRYPDAVLIATHRDPTACVASTASLITYLHGVSSREARPREVGHMASDFIARCADGLVADAAAHTGESAMLHVAYPELVRDPLSVVRGLYADMGRELGLDAERAMVDHIKQRPQHKYGVHRYALNDYGLEQAVLDERHRSYCEIFGLDHAPRMPD